MNQVKILTDSCSDLGEDLLTARDIGYARMNIVVRGEEKPASLLWDLYTPQELYGVMREGERVTTTQVPAQEFLTVFGKVLEEGNDIVYIGCSSALSGSVNTARVVARQLGETYPDRKIFCIDSINSSLGEGLLAVRAADLRDAGKSAEEIAAAIEEEKIRVNQFCTVANLDTLRRAGRVKGSAAFFGNLFGVKPIIVSDVNGQNVPVKKVKGRIASLDEIVNMLADAIGDDRAQCIYISHADCADDAAYVEKKVKEKIPEASVYLNYIGPIIGASIGPGAIALFGTGRPVTVAG